MISKNEETRKPAERVISPVIIAPPAAGKLAAGFNVGQLWKFIVDLT